MTYDPTRDCEHGRLKGKCDVCDLQAEVERLTELLNNPEEHYPGNFDTPQRANALLTGLCQDAATEIERLTAEAEADKIIIEYHEATIERLNKALAAQPAPAAQKPWVGLTDEERDELYAAHHDSCGYPITATGYEKAIEAKLKEKNT